MLTEAQQYELVKLTFQIKKNHPLRLENHFQRRTLAARSKL
jgi:hypothetical protein